MTTLTAQTAAIRSDGTSGNEIRNVSTYYLSLFLGFNTNSTRIVGCQVRNAYKDAIHFARNSSGNIVEWNFIRNTGDDSIAFVSYDSPGMEFNIARFNTTELGHWGRGFVIAGGDNNRLQNNVAIDQTASGLLAVVESYNSGAYRTVYNTNFLISDNVVLRCGNDRSYAWGGAIGLRANVDVPMSGSVQRNTVLSSPFNVVRASGFLGDQSTGEKVQVFYNTLYKPTTAGWASEFVSLSSGSHFSLFSNTYMP